MRQLFFSLFIICLFGPLYGQEVVHGTFKDTRVINSHSVETLGKRKLDVRIAHRFGDLAGDRGGWQSFYGLENAEDIMIGAEFGVTDRLMIGLNRTKGSSSSPIGKFINGLVKYQLLRQKTGEGSAFTLAALGVMSISTDKKTDNEELINSFPMFSDRMSYTLQLLAARKFSDNLSIQLGPAYTHRNLVEFNDENALFSLSAAARIRVTKVYSIILDANVPFSELRNSENGFHPSLGIGLEIETGGHVFQVNLTNVKGLVENDYIPYSKSNWGDGEFRLGFTISRLFNL